MHNRKTIPAAPARPAVRPRVKVTECCGGTIIRTYPLMDLPLPGAFMIDFARSS